MFKNNIIEEFSNLPIREQYSDKPNNIGKWDTELKKEECYPSACTAVGTNKCNNGTTCEYTYILNFKNNNLKIDNDNHLYKIDDNKYIFPSYDNKSPIKVNSWEKILDILM